MSGYRLASFGSDMRAGDMRNCFYIITACMCHFSGRAEARIKPQHDLSQSDASHKLRAIKKARETRTHRGRFGFSLHATVSEPCCLITRFHNNHAVFCLWLSELFFFPFYNQASVVENVPKQELGVFPKSGGIPSRHMPHHTTPLSGGSKGILSENACAFPKEAN